SGADAFRRSRRPRCSGPMNQAGRTPKYREELGNAARRNRCRCDREERHTAPSQPRIPLVAAIFPEAALALADTVEPFDGLDAGQVFGVLVADLALDAQPQRRAVA